MLDGVCRLLAVASRLLEALADLTAKGADLEPIRTVLESMTGRPNAPKWDPRGAATEYNGFTGMFKFDSWRGWRVGKLDAMGV